MKFKAEFTMDNAAFEDNPEEIPRILKRIALLTGDWREACDLNGCPINDLNGNRIGQWSIEA